MRTGKPRKGGAFRPRLLRSSGGDEAVDDLWVGFTLWVNAGEGDGGPGRIVFCADDPSLTRFAGLAISGELARSLRLVELVDAELAAVERVAPVEQRRRGALAGRLGGGDRRVAAGRRGLL